MLAACAAPATPATAPDGLTFSVYQTRFDANARQLQFHIENQSGQEITFTSAGLDSPLFGTPVLWQGESTVADGRARDLKASLPDAACPRPEEASATASFDFVLEDGRTGTVTVVPEDPMGILPGLTAADCLNSALETHARLEIVSVESSGQPGSHAMLTLQITPTSAPGGLIVSAGSPQQNIVLQLEPTRCDPHAVAEDKQGTLFPVVFTSSEGEAGKIRIAAPDAIRSQLYEFVGDHCEF